MRPKLFFPNSVLFGTGIKGEKTNLFLLVDPFIPLQRTEKDVTLRTKSCIV